MKKRIALALFVTVGLSCAAVQAVDLTGEWKVVPGKSQGVISGKPAHPTGFSAADRHVTVAEPGASPIFVLKIVSQKANGFHGQWCSPKKCEKAVGVIRKDGSILMVDEDSTYLGTMYENEMELCVTQAGKPLRIAICSMMAKQ